MQLSLFAEKHESPWQKWLDGVPVRTVETEKDLALLLGKIRLYGTAAIDTETTGLDPHRDQIRLIQCAIAPGPVDSPEKPCEVWVVDLKKIGALDRFIEIVQDAGIKKIMHNAKFDLAFFRAAAGKRIPMPLVFDTMIASQLVTAGHFIPESRFESYLKQQNVRKIKVRGAVKYYDEHNHEIHFHKESQKKTKPVYVSHSLQQVAHRHLEVWLDKEFQTADWDSGLDGEMLRYAARDAAVLLPLFEVLKKLIRLNRLEKVAVIEMDCLPAVVEIELSGMPFDAQKARELLEQHAHEEQEAVLKLARHVSNPNSSAQIQEVVKRLAAESGLLAGEEMQINGEVFPVSTSDDVLNRVAARLPENHPLGKLIKSVQQYRAVKKKTDFLRAWLEDLHPVTGRLHPDLKQLNPQGVGRFSAREPNLQQVGRDKEIRSLFRAEAGKKLVLVDYSGIEMRIMAQLSKDRTLIKAFKEGVDIHRFTAARISGKPLDEVTKDERQAAKACFSADTEILTINGWVRFDAYDGVTPVAQYILPNGITYNPKYGDKNAFAKDTLGRIEFITPLAFRNFDADKLVIYENEKVSLMITPDHEIIYLDYLLRPCKKPACQVKPRSVNYMICAGSYEVSPYLSEIETRLLAMLVADSAFEKSGKYAVLRLKKQTKINRCEKLLNSANWAYTVRQYPGGRVEIRVKIPDDVLQKYRRCIDFGTRELQWSCLNLINGKTYLEEAQWWDSYRYTPQTELSPAIYFTSIRKQTVDVMQAMAVLSGIPAVTYHEVRNNNSKYYRTGQLYYLSYALDRPPLRSVRWKPAVVDGNYKVYCVQVLSGAIIVRRNGKPVVCGNCNFGLIYGLSATGLQTYSETGYGAVITLDEARRMREGFFKTYPGIEGWQRKQSALASQKNFKDYWTYRPGEGFVCEKRSQVRTLAGRLRVWPVEQGRQGLKKVGPVTELYNTPDQGTGADMMKLAMGRLYRELLARGWDVKIIATVHDELILESPEETAEEAKKLLEEVMLKAARELLPDVPVEVEGGVVDSWAEK